MTDTARLAEAERDMIECQWCGSMIESGEQVSHHLAAVTLDMSQGGPVALESCCTPPSCIQCAEISARYAVRLDSQLQAIIRQLRLEQTT